MALADPTITEQANSVTLMTAVVIVLMFSLYTHAQGDKLAVTVPHRLTLSRLRDTTVSSEVIDFVGGRGQVRVEVVGDVGATVVAVKPAAGAIESIPARSRRIEGGDLVYVVARPDVIRRLESRSTML